MKIGKNYMVKDLQDRFEEEYPLLQLRVYKVQHDHFEASRKKDEVSENTMLIDLNPELNDGIIVLNDTMTVDQLETAMEEEFGLHVQVFRKSGDLWLQTSSTDSWSLRKHAQKAKESEAFAKKD